MVSVKCAQEFDSESVATGYMELGFLREACRGQQIRSQGLIPAGQRHVFWVIVANSNKITGRIQSSDISNIFKIQKNNPVFSLCQSSHLLLSAPSQGHFLTIKREHNDHSCITELEMKEERMEGEEWIEERVNECIRKMLLDLWGDS